MCGTPVTLQATQTPQQQQQLSVLTPNKSQVQPGGVGKVPSARITSPEMKASPQDGFPSSLSGDHGDGASSARDSVGVPSELRKAMNKNPGPLFWPVETDSKNKNKAAVSQSSRAFITKMLDPTAVSEHAAQHQGKPNNVPQSYIDYLIALRDLQTKLAEASNLTISISSELQTIINTGTAFIRAYPELDAIEQAYNSSVQPHESKSDLKTSLSLSAATPVGNLALLGVELAIRLLSITQAANTSAETLGSLIRPSHLLFNTVAILIGCPVHVASANGRLHSGCVVPSLQSQSSALLDVKSLPWLYTGVPASVQATISHTSLLSQSLQKFSNLAAQYAGSGGWRCIFTAFCEAKGLLLLFEHWRRPQSTQDLVALTALLHTIFSVANPHSLSANSLDSGASAASLNATLVPQLKYQQPLSPSPVAATPADSTDTQDSGGWVQAKPQHKKGSYAAKLAQTETKSQEASASQSSTSQVSPAISVTPQQHVLEPHFDALLESLAHTLGLAPETSSTVSKLARSTVADDLRLFTSILMSIEALSVATWSSRPIPAVLDQIGIPASYFRPKLLQFAARLVNESDSLTVKLAGLSIFEQVAFASWHEDAQCYSSILTSASRSNSLRLPACTFVASRLLTSRVLLSALDPSTVHFERIRRTSSLLQFLLATLVDLAPALTKTQLNALGLLSPQTPAKPHSGPSGDSQPQRWLVPLIEPIFKSLWTLVNTDDESESTSAASVIMNALPRMSLAMIRTFVEIAESAGRAALTPRGASLLAHVSLHAFTIIALPIPIVTLDSYAEAKRVGNNSNIFQISSEMLGAEPPSLFALPFLFRSLVQLLADDAAGSVNSSEGQQRLTPSYLFAYLGAIASKAVLLCHDKIRSSFFDMLLVTIIEAASDEGSNTSIVKQLAADFALAILLRSLRALPEGGLGLRDGASTVAATHTVVTLKHQISPAIGMVPTSGWGIFLPPVPQFPSYLNFPLETELETDLAARALQSQFEPTNHISGTTPETSSAAAGGSKRSVISHVSGELATKDQVEDASFVVPTAQNDQSVREVSVTLPRLWYVIQGLQARYRLTLVLSLLIVMTPPIAIPIAVARLSLLGFLVASVSGCPDAVELSPEDTLPFRPAYDLIRAYDLANESGALPDACLERIWCRFFGAIAKPKLVDDFTEGISIALPQSVQATYSLCPSDWASISDEVTVSPSRITPSYPNMATSKLLSSLPTLGRAAILSWFTTSILASYECRPGSYILDRTRYSRWVQSYLYPTLNNSRLVNSEDAFRQSLGTAPEGHPSEIISCPLEEHAQALLLEAHFIVETLRSGQAEAASPAMRNLHFLRPMLPVPVMKHLLIMLAVLTTPPYCQEADVCNANWAGVWPKLLHPTHHPLLLSTDVFEMRLYPSLAQAISVRSVVPASSRKFAYVADCNIPFPAIESSVTSDSTVAWNPSWSAEVLPTSLSTQTMLAASTPTGTLQSLLMNPMHKRPEAETAAAAKELADSLGMTLTPSLISVLATIKLTPVCWELLWSAATGARAIPAAACAARLLIQVTRSVSSSVPRVDRCALATRFVLNLFDRLDLATSSILDPRPEDEDQHIRAFWMARVARLVIILTAVATDCDVMTLLHWDVPRNGQDLLTLASMEEALHTLIRQTVLPIGDQSTQLSNDSKFDSPRQRFHSEVSFGGRFPSAGSTSSFDSNLVASLKFTNVTLTVNPDHNTMSNIVAPGSGPTTQLKPLVLTIPKTMTALEVKRLIGVHYRHPYQCIHLAASGSGALLEGIPIVCSLAGRAPSAHITVTCQFKPVPMSLAAYITSAIHAQAGQQTFAQPETQAGHEGKTGEDVFSLITECQSLPSVADLILDKLVLSPFFASAAQTNVAILPAASEPGKYQRHRRPTSLDQVEVRTLEDLYSVVEEDHLDEDLTGSEMTRVSLLRTQSVRQAFGTLSTGQVRHEHGSRIVQLVSDINRNTVEFDESCALGAASTSLQRLPGPNHFSSAAAQTVSALISRQPALFNRLWRLLDTSLSLPFVTVAISRLLHCIPIHIPLVEGLASLGTIKPEEVRADEMIQIAEFVTSLFCSVSKGSDHIQTFNSARALYTLRIVTEFIDTASPSFSSCVPQYEAKQIVLSKDMLGSPASISHLLQMPEFRSLSESITGSTVATESRSAPSQKSSQTKGASKGKSTSECPDTREEKSDDDEISRVFEKLVPLLPAQLWYGYDPLAIRTQRLHWINGFVRFGGLRLLLKIFLQTVRSQSMNAATFTESSSLWSLVDKYSKDLINQPATSFATRCMDLMALSQTARLLCLLPGHTLATCAELTGPLPILTRIDSSLGLRGTETKSNQPSSQQRNNQQRQRSQIQLKQQPLDRATLEKYRAKTAWARDPMNSSPTLILRDLADAAHQLLYKLALVATFLPRQDSISNALMTSSFIDSQKQDLIVSLTKFAKSQVIRSRYDGPLHASQLIGQLLERCGSISMFLDPFTSRALIPAIDAVTGLLQLAVLRCCESPLEVNSDSDQLRPNLAQLADVNVDLVLATMQYVFPPTHATTPVSNSNQRSTSNESKSLVPVHPSGWLDRVIPTVKDVLDVIEVVSSDERGPLVRLSSTIRQLVFCPTPAITVASAACCFRLAMACHDIYARYKNNQHHMSPSQILLTTILRAIANVAECHVPFPITAPHLVFSVSSHALEVALPLAAALLSSLAGNADQTGPLHSFHLPYILVATAAHSDIFGPTIQAVLGRIRDKAHAESTDWIQRTPVGLMIRTSSRRDALILLFSTLAAYLTNMAPPIFALPLPVRWDDCSQQRVTTRPSEYQRRFLNVREKLKPTEAEAFTSALASMIDLLLTCDPMLMTSIVFPALVQSVVLTWGPPPPLPTTGSLTEGALSVRDPSTPSSSQQPSKRRDYVLNLLSRLVNLTAYKESFTRGTDVETNAEEWQRLEAHALRLFSRLLHRLSYCHVGTSPTLLKAFPARVADAIHLSAFEGFSKQFSLPQLTEPETTGTFAFDPMAPIDPSEGTLPTLSSQKSLTSDLSLPESASHLDDMPEVPPGLQRTSSFAPEGINSQTQLAKVRDPSQLINDLQFGIDVGRFAKVGFAGLVNLGNTCYINSLLQQVRLAPAFLKLIRSTDASSLLAVKSDSVSQTNVADPSVLCKLQKLVCNLTLSPGATLDPSDFITSCRGWDGNPINVKLQMDVAEFLSSFFETLSTLIDQSRQSNAPKGGLKEVFGCETVTYLSHSCGHSAIRPPEWQWLVCVEVAGVDALEDAIKKYLSSERLVGNNAVMCSICGTKQDTERRTLLYSLPKTLIIQLKRFEFDYSTGQQRKLNHQVSFPLELDFASVLSDARAITSSVKQQEEERKQLGSNTPAKSGRGRNRRGRPQTPHSSGRGSTTTGASKEPEVIVLSDYELEGKGRYRLVGTLCHTGQASSGHYYSYIRKRSLIADADPTLAEDPYGTWFELNDTLVTPFNVLSDLAPKTFGGVEQVKADRDQVSIEKQHSAYLLFYELIPEKTSDSRVSEHVLNDITPLYEATVWPSYLRSQVFSLASNAVKLSRELSMFSPSYLASVQSLLDQFSSYASHEGHDSPSASKIQQSGLDALVLAYSIVTDVVMRIKDDSFTWTASDIYAYAAPSSNPREGAQSPAVQQLSSMTQPGNAGQIVTFPSTSTLFGEIPVSETVSDQAVAAGLITSNTSQSSTTAMPILQGWITCIKRLLSSFPLAECLLRIQIERNGCDVERLQWPPCFVDPYLLSSALYNAPGPVRRLMSTLWLDLLSSLYTRDDKNTSEGEKTDSARFVLTEIWLAANVNVLELIYSACERKDSSNASMNSTTGNSSEPSGKPDFLRSAEWVQLIASVLELAPELVVTKTCSDRLIPLTFSFFNLGVLEYNGEISAGSVPDKESASKKLAAVKLVDSCLKLLTSVLTSVPLDVRRNAARMAAGAPPLSYSAQGEEEEKSTKIHMNQYDQVAKSLVPAYTALFLARVFTQPLPLPTANFYAASQPGGANAGLSATNPGPLLPIYSAAPMLLRILFRDFPPSSLDPLSELFSSCLWNWQAANSRCGLAPDFRTSTQAKPPAPHVIFSLGVSCLALCEATTEIPLIDINGNGVTTQVTQDVRAAHAIGMFLEAVGKIGPLTIWPYSSNAETLCRVLILLSRRSATVAKYIADTLHLATAAGGTKQSASVKHSLDLYVLSFDPHIAMLTAPKMATPLKPKKETRAGIVSPGPASDGVTASNSNPSVPQTVSDLCAELESPRLSDDDRRLRIAKIRSRFAISQAYIRSAVLTMQRWMSSLPSAATPVTVSLETPTWLFDIPSVVPAQRIEQADQTGADTDSRIAAITEDARNVCLEIAMSTALTVKSTATFHLKTAVALASPSVTFTNPSEPSESELAALASQLQGQINWVAFIGGALRAPLPAQFQLVIGGKTGHAATQATKFASAQPLQQTPQSARKKGK